MARGGQVKSFNVKENQIAWTNYNALMLDQGRPQTSINQYKPVLLKLEETTDKAFSDISVSEIENFMKQRQNKNSNHLNGFYVTCINNDWITANKEIILYLIPIEYSKMLSKLFEK